VCDLCVVQSYIMCRVLCVCVCVLCVLCRVISSTWGCVCVCFVCCAELYQVHGGVCDLCVVQSYI